MCLCLYLNSLIRTWLVRWVETFHHVHWLNWSMLSQCKSFGVLRWHWVAGQVLGLGIDVKVLCLLVMSHFYLLLLLLFDFCSTSRYFHYFHSLLSVIQSPTLFYDPLNPLSFCFPSSVLHSYFDPSLLTSIFYILSMFLCSVSIIIFLPSVHYSLPSLPVTIFHMYYTSSPTLSFFFPSIASLWLISFSCDIIFWLIFVYYTLFNAAHL